MHISSFQRSRAASASASVHPFFITVYLKSSSRHIPQNNEPIFFPCRVFPKYGKITKNAQLPPRPTSLSLLRLNHPGTWRWHSVSLGFHQRAGRRVLAAYVIDLHRERIHSISRSIDLTRCRAPHRGRFTRIDAYATVLILASITLMYRRSNYYYPVSIYLV